MATSNPAFSNDMFAGYEQVYGAPRSTTMTVQGTAVKTFMLLAIMGATATWSWNALASGDIAFGVVAISGIGGFITAMITIFKPNVAPIDRADLRGVRRGLPGCDLPGDPDPVRRQVSGRGWHRDAGRQPDRRRAICDDVCLCDATHPCHRQVTDGDRRGDRRAGTFLRGFDACSACSASVCRWSSPRLRLGIGFSLFVVGLAAFNLLMDFDFIEKSAEHEAPKFMEWYGAFGLMVTLIWLYMEILRLLMKLADRR